MCARELALSLALLLGVTLQVVDALKCGDGYTCYEDPNSDVVWVMKNAGNLYGPSCSSVCSDALCGSGTFHQCVDGTPAPTKETFGTIANGLGFSCGSGGCWRGVAPGSGMVLVDRNNRTLEDGTVTRTCYFPTEERLSCQNSPGNANCFNARFSTICPCKAQKSLESACPWTCPPENTNLATWPANPEGTSCIDRINYWRKRACDEGWPECPPCGLPPMVECTACHECANSQSQYDSENGAHKSFKRCGDMVQGQGGGKTCAAVIDAFVSERKVFDDSDGKVVCRGHCGPIVAPGCNTFFWGRSQNGSFYTLNWRTCNAAKCSSYCANPTSNPCFTLPDLSPDPDTCAKPPDSSSFDVVSTVKVLAHAPTSPHPPQLAGVSSSTLDKAKFKLGVAAAVGGPCSVNVQSVTDVTLRAMAAQVEYMVSTRTMDEAAVVTTALAANTTLSKALVDAGVPTTGVDVVSAPTTTVITPPPSTSNAPLSSPSLRAVLSLVSLVVASLA